VSEEETTAAEAAAAEERNLREEEREEQTLILRSSEIFHDNGIYLPSRTIYMGSDPNFDGGDVGVDCKMAERFVKNLHMLEAMAPDRVTVLMNNPGGDVYNGLAIFDAIQLSRCPITIKARGYAMSMGSIILQAATRPGDKRLIGPSAVQMIHYGTDSITHHAKTVYVRALEGERINDWMEKMYLERIHKKLPNFTLEELQKMLNFDKFLTAQESIDLGLADEIG
jgi:ATP-dependent Clp protease protease subunit